jgi:hypothetical protein
LDQTTPNPNRTARAGLSTALIVGLLIGVTIASVRPGISAAARDGTSQRQATRHLAQSLARVVRELASAEKNRPAFTWVRAARPGQALSCGSCDVSAKPLAACLLREGLLSLPPPTV